MTGSDTEQFEQRKRIRKSTISFSLLALGFYLGFIALSVLRSRH